MDFDWTPEEIAFREEVREFIHREMTEEVKGSIFIDTPAKTDPTLCRRRKEGKPHSPIRGDCARICPVPIVRERLPKRLQGMVEAWQAKEHL